MRKGLVVFAILLSACNTPATPRLQPTDTPTPGIIIAQADAAQRLAIINAEATQAQANLDRVNAIAAQQAAYALQTAQAFTRSVTATANHLFVISETAKITQQAHWVEMTAAAGWANATQQARATDIYIDAERARVNAKIQSDERWESYKENTGLTLFGIICLAVLVFFGILAWKFDAILDTLIRLVIDWREMRTREKLVEMAAGRMINIGGKQYWVEDDGKPRLMLEKPRDVSPDNMRAWLLACREIAIHAEKYGWAHDDLGEVQGGMYILSRSDWDNVTDYLRDCKVLHKRPASKTRYLDGWDYKRVLRELDKHMIPTELPPPVVKAPKLYTGELSKAT